MGNVISILCWLLVEGGVGFFFFFFIINFILRKWYSCANWTASRSKEQFIPSFSFHKAIFACACLIHYSLLFWWILSVPFSLYNVVWHPKLDV